MIDSEAIDAARRLNEVLMSRPWLDVDVVECSPQATVLHCGIDLTAAPEIEIKFDSVFFVSFSMSWKTDTSRTVVRVLSGQEAFRLNGVYQIEQGYHLFAFSPEDLAPDVEFIIAARAISWRSVRDQGNEGQT